MERNYFYLKIIKNHRVYKADKLFQLLVLPQNSPLYRFTFYEFQIKLIYS